MDLSYLKKVSREQLLSYVGHMDQMAGIKAVEATDGWARGSRMFNVYTGSGLTFTVTPDRSMDISACHYKGLSLAWNSSVGDVAPAFYEADGLNWLRSFAGGMLVTCGLDHYGSPCQDEGETFGQHGRISNVPARYVNHAVDWDGDTYLLSVAGEMHQVRIFGEDMLLRRTISTALGSNTIHIGDEVVNQGFGPQPHQILYHFNVGYPLLQPSTQLKVEVEHTAIRPNDGESQKGLDKWNSFHEPVVGCDEQVFIHTPRADGAGRVKVEVFNPDLGVGVRWSYDKKNLPYLVEWKMMRAGLYVLGVEPTNSSVVGGRAAARKAGALPMLAGGESVRYAIDLEVFERK